MKRIIKTRVVAVLAMLFTVTTLLSGCSITGVNHSQNINIDDYEWAIFMSENPRQGWLPKDFTGYVAFVRDDGSFNLIKHAGMDAGGIAWTHRGIYFADEKGDHWITSSGSKYVKQDRDELMDGLVTLSDGVTQVGVYNAGFSEHGYQEQVVVSRPDSSKFQQITTIAIYPVISACGDDVYAATREPSEDDNVIVYFDQLVHNGVAKHTNVGTTKVAFQDFGFENIDAPCVAGHIYFLGELSGDGDVQDALLKPYMKHHDGGGKRVDVLVSMDIHDGSIDWVPLVTESSEDLGLSTDNLYYSKFDAQSFDNTGNLVWFGGNGVLYRTDVKTGKTTILNNELEQKNSTRATSTLVFRFF